MEKKGENYRDGPWDPVDHDARIAAQVAVVQRLAHATKHLADGFAKERTLAADLKFELPCGLQSYDVQFNF